MAKPRISIWMGPSAAVLAALSLAACGGGQPAPPAASAAIAPAPATELAVTAAAPSAAESATPAAAVAQDAPASAPQGPDVTAPVVAPKAPAAMPTPPAAKAAATPVSSDTFVDGPGKAVVEKACTSCHEASQVTTQRRGKDQWRDTVEKMIGYGAPVSDPEFETIVAYLTRHYGPGG